MNEVYLNTLPIDVNGEGDSKLNRILNGLIIALTVLVIIVTMFNFTYCSVYVVESSMYPTLVGAPSENKAGGEYVYAEIGADFTYGDIVIISVKEGSIDRKIIKRVVALGGDTLYLDKGKLYVDYKGGQEGDFVLVEEPYAVKNNPNLAKNTMEKTTVPEGKIFVLGDNRDVSKDSRDKSYGCIDASNVFAVVPQWALDFKGIITAINTFTNFTLPSFFGVKK